MTSSWLVAALTAERRKPRPTSPGDLSFTEDAQAIAPNISIGWRVAFLLRWKCA